MDRQTSVRNNFLLFSRLASRCPPESFATVPRRAARVLTVERTGSLLIAMLVLLGLLLRARGFLFQQGHFWMDESSWALMLFENNGADDSLRPIGFLAAV